MWSFPVSTGVVSTPKRNALNNLKAPKRARVHPSEMPLDGIYSPLDADPRSPWIKTDIEPIKLYYVI